MKERLKETCKLAKEHLTQAQNCSQEQFNRNKPKLQTLKRGDKVLIFLPTSPKKLLVHWQGHLQLSDD